MMMFSFFSILTLLFPLIFLILIGFVIYTLHHAEKRADEKIAIDRENMALQLKQIQGIDERLTRIETLLKEVD
ncbi:MAG: hypothetical protein ABF586_03160 [Sporolactobacillus sp.]